MRRRNYFPKEHKEQWVSVLKEGKWRYDGQMAQFFSCWILVMTFNWRCIDNEEDLHPEEIRC